MRREEPDADEHDRSLSASDSERPVVGVGIARRLGRLFGETAADTRVVVPPATVGSRPRPHHPPIPRPFVIYLLLMKKKKLGTNVKLSGYLRETSRAPLAPVMEFSISRRDEGKVGWRKKKKKRWREQSAR